MSASVYVDWDRMHALRLLSQELKEVLVLSSGNSDDSECSPRQARI